MIYIYIILGIFAVVLGYAIINSVATTSIVMDDLKRLRKDIDSTYKYSSEWNTHTKDMIREVRKDMELLERKLIPYYVVKKNNREELFALSDYTKEGKPVFKATISVNPSGYKLTHKPNTYYLEEAIELAKQYDCDVYDTRTGKII